MITGGTGSNGLKTVAKYAEMLRRSGNVILHGAPGTGKTHLAQQIAACLITGDAHDGGDEDGDWWGELVKSGRAAMVQFHPSYDYTDFVEGLRPVTGADGSIGFELRDGVFKRFVKDERKEGNLPDARTMVMEFLKEAEKAEGPEGVFTTDKQNKTFRIRVGRNGETVNVTGVGNNPTVTHSFPIRNLVRAAESNQSFERVRDLANFLGDQGGEFSCLYAVWKEFTAWRVEKYPKPDPYVFIIDEINRGEISKIFGELFFSIDPGYRGPKGSVRTQYDSMHPGEQFYVPENVYIIGTMNDIDRSVDTFDFAMRRRFRFIEIGAKDTQEAILGTLSKKEVRDEAVRHMDALNKAIDGYSELGKSYEIGAAYFTKLDEVDGDFNALWNNYIEPLLREYLRGVVEREDLKKKMEEFRKEYASGSSDAPANETTEAAKGQGEEPGEQTTDQANGR